MRALLAGALLVASVAGIAYLALALQRTIAFGRRKAHSDATPEFTPPVTVFKPLCGLEPALFENLCSFCDQDYPAFQIIFGVRDADDPAAAVARRVIERFSERDVSLVVDDRVRGANLKVANVLNMVASAKHDILIVADSDVRVDRAYLRSVVAPFADERIGAVTCLYRGVAENGPKGPLLHGRINSTAPSPLLQASASELGAMFINEQFAPSVLVAVALSPMDFCLGATMAVTRKALESIGGFESISPYLADDQMLGKLVRRHGLRVEISPYVVETSALDADFWALWEHEARWARTMHAARPWGYSFSFIAYGLPLAVAFALVSGGAGLGLAAAGVALALRLCLHYAARNALGVRTPDKLWLIPVRDVLGLAVWGAHFFGGSIRWREARYKVDRSGRLIASDFPHNEAG